MPLIVGTNADEARLFTRFLKVLPTTEQMIEALLAGAGDATRDRIIAAYPDYPARPRPVVRIGGDFAFSSAAWQVAEAHGTHAPTYVYRYDYAPRTLALVRVRAPRTPPNCSRCSTVYRRPVRLGADRGRRPHARRAGSAGTCSRGGWSSVAHGGPGDDWPATKPPSRAVMVFDRRSRVEFDPDHAAPAQRLGRLLADATDRPTDRAT